MIFQDQNILSKTLNQNPYCPGPGSSDFSEFLSDRSTGSRPALDRHAQFCACAYQSTGTRPILDRPKPVTLWKLPVDRIGRPTVHSRRAVDSPVDRWLQRSEKWPLAGRPAVDRQFWQNPNGSIFLKPINWDFVNCFEVKIFETSWADFLILLEEFLHKI